MVLAPRLLLKSIVPLLVAVPDASKASAPVMFLSTPVLVITAPAVLVAVRVRPPALALIIPLFTMPAVPVAVNAPAVTVPALRILPAFNTVPAATPAFTLPELLNAPPIVVAVVVKFKLEPAATLTLPAAAKLVGVRVPLKFRTLAV